MKETNETGSRDRNLYCKEVETQTRRNRKRLAVRKENTAKQERHEKEIEETRSRDTNVDCKKVNK